VLSTLAKRAGCTGGFIFVLFFIAFLCGCAGVTSTNKPPTPGPTPSIVVSISPASSSVQAGQTQSFTATVTNDSQGKGVNWTLSGVACTGTACGTLSASSSASGAPITYTAPTSVASSATVSLTATSVSDGTKSGVATITVVTAPPAITLTVSPASATVKTGATQSFVATVSNDTQSKGVTWALSGVGCSGATCGTLSAASTASGVPVTYTAPTSLPSQGTVTLKAVSVSDATKSAIAAITITTNSVPIVVTVSPTAGSIQTGGSQNFTATVTNDSLNQGVTWALLGANCSQGTCPGTLSASSSASGVPIIYTAPTTLPALTTLTLRATSVADSTKSADATITLTSSALNITVAVSPSLATVETNGNQSFTATVQNDSQNKGVSWALSGIGCTGVTCGTLSAPSSASGSAIIYTAPAALPSPTVITLTATSLTDTTKSSAATITLTSPAVSVTVSPLTTSVQAKGTQAFTATVANDSQGKGVTWALGGAGCSGASCGKLSATFSASGAPITYTAPANVPSPPEVTLTATSAADSTKFEAATITVTPAPGAIVVTISPTSATVSTGTSQNFIATVQNDPQNKGVTWMLIGSSCGESTCGSLSASSSGSGVAITYTAPTTVPDPASVILRATSVTDPTRTVAVTITIM
jgi:hypothetical protein